MYYGCYTLSNNKKNRIKRILIFDLDFEVIHEIDVIKPIDIEAYIAGMK